MSKRPLNPEDVAAFCAGKTVVSMNAEMSEATTWFTDGTGLYLVMQRGYEYSENTADPDEIQFFALGEP